jgi:lysophospholipid acyltransferase (LPLAT)-like uncharacterized protein
MLKGAGEFLKITVGGFVLGCVIKILYWSVRWEYVDREQLDGGERNQAVVFSFWHNRIALMPGVYRRLVGSAVRRCYALISLHGDGRLIAKAIELFGLRSVAGSSTRGGRAAVHEMVRLGQSGFDLAITPDGPRGPKYVCKSGAITIASLADMRIYPLGVAVSRFWRLGSWDRMIIPKPFSRGVVIVGVPLDTLDSEEREALRLKLEQQMIEVTRRADAFWSVV